MSSEQQRGRSVYDILYELYEEVNSKCDEDTLPSVSDYLDAVIAYRKENSSSDSSKQTEPSENEDNSESTETEDNSESSEAENGSKSTTTENNSDSAKTEDDSESTKAKSELVKARDSLKHTVINALRKLVNRGILTRYGSKYVSNLKGLEYYSRQELIRRKCLQYGEVIKLSEKAILLTLDDSQLGDQNDFFNFYYVYEYKEQDATTPSTEKNEIHQCDIKAEEVDYVTSYHEKNTTAKKENPTECELLKKEIEELKKKIDTISKEIVYNENIEELKKLVQGYLCRISFVNIFKLDDVLLIVIDSDDPEAADQITQKLQGLIDETRPVLRPFVIEKKRVFYK